MDKNGLLCIIGTFFPFFSRILSTTPALDNLNRPFVALFSPRVLKFLGFINIYPAPFNNIKVKLLNIYSKISGIKELYLPLLHC